MAGLTCNFDATGKLNTIPTRSTSAGRTSNGIAHGAGWTASLSCLDDRAAMATTATPSMGEVAR